MQNYKMMIAYDGRKYKGFRRTKKDGEKSIQFKLERILFKLYDETIEIVSAVSTDAGVHATGQIVNFKVPKDKFTRERILDYLEEYLPDDIIVINIEEADERFHSRYNITSLVYEYRLWKKDAPRRPLFDRQFVNVMDQFLDVKDMKACAKVLEGEHNFSAFSTNSKSNASVRDVYSIDIEETPEEIIIKIEASGFLLSMERIIVGTLIQIGTGQKDMDTVEDAFYTLNSRNVGHKARAGALCLVGVNF